MKKEANSFGIVCWQKKKLRQHFMDSIERTGYQVSEENELYKGRRGAKRGTGVNTECARG